MSAIGARAMGLRAVAGRYRPVGFIFDRATQLRTTAVDEVRAAAAADHRIAHARD